MFFNFEPGTTLLREASLLSRAGNWYWFVHRSVLEYFFSCTIWETTRSGEEFGPHAFWGSAGIKSSMADHPLSRKNLVPEPSIIHFLSERVQVDPSFKQHLLSLIDLSKFDIHASQAAANAITTLVRAGVQFNGFDLRSIRIPGADLTAGQFDSALLQDSVLTGVNFTKTWIRQVDFSRAQMEGTRFGELPHLEENVRIWSCAFSPDKKSFAVGLENGDITIYDTFNWTKIQTFEGHEGKVKCLSYSPNSQHLLSGGRDQTVRLWNCETGSTGFVLEGHDQGVQVVAFSPSGNQVTSASGKTVRLWDTETGVVAFVLTDHTGMVKDVAYSPDGNNIATCGYDGTIRVFIFITQTGQVFQSTETRNVKYGCCVYSPDGQRIVAGDGGGILQVWNAATLLPGPSWNTHAFNVHCVKFSPTGQETVSSSNDNTLRMWDGKTGALISTLRGHLGAVTSFVFSPDGSKICLGELMGDDCETLGGQPYGDWSWHRRFPRMLD